MSVPGSHEIEVLSGNARETLRWVVVCAGDNDDLYTQLRVYDKDTVAAAGSGFGGPPQRIRAERDGVVVDERPQRMPPPRPSPA
jgi:O-succinylbenzoate synthase